MPPPSDRAPAVLLPLVPPALPASVPINLHIHQRLHACLFDEGKQLTFRPQNVATSHDAVNGYT